MVKNSKIGENGETSQESKGFQQLPIFKPLYLETIHFTCLYFLEGSVIISSTYIL